MFHICHKKNQFGTEREVIVNSMSYLRNIDVKTTVLYTVYSKLYDDKI